MFGLFELQRAVYATRYGQKIAAVPLDKHLGLPQGRHSYLLQDWGQHLAVQVPFATDSKTLSRILDFTPIGAHPGTSPARVGHAGRGVLEGAPAPAGRGGRDLLVCTADGRGVPMRGGAKAATGVAPLSSSGMRPGTKKMALVAAVSTVDRFMRTPDQVLDALFEEAPAG